MKDALGHGSDVLANRLSRFVGAAHVSPADRNRWMGQRFHPVDDNDAAQRLAAARPKADPSPTHPAFGRRGA